MKIPTTRTQLWLLYYTYNIIRPNSCFYPHSMILNSFSFQYVWIGSCEKSTIIIITRTPFKLNSLEFYWNECKTRIWFGLKYRMNLFQLQIFKKNVPQWHSAFLFKRNLQHSSLANLFQWDWGKRCDGVKYYFKPLHFS